MQSATATSLMASASYRHQLEILNRVSVLINAALDLDGILQVALQESLKAVGSTQGSIMLINRVINAMEIKAQVIDNQFVVPEPERKLWLGEGGVVNHVVKNGQPYNCPNLGEDPLFTGFSATPNACSLLCVPIISYGRVLGTFNAESASANYFTPNDVQLLSALANHIAIAVESQILREIGAALATLSLDEILYQIVEKACILLGTESSALILLENGGHGENLGIKFSLGGSQPTYPRKNGLTAQVVETGQLIIIEDAQHDPRVKPTTQARGVKSIMGIPLKLNNEHHPAAPTPTIGALFVNCTEDRRFNQRDQDLLRSLAGQAALAIERAQLHKEVVYERDRSERTITQLLALQGISQEIQRELDLSRLLDLIVQLAARLLDGDAAGILLLDDTKQYLSFHSVYGLSDHFTQQTRIGVGASIAGQVVQQGQALIANDIPHHPDFDNPAAAAEGLQAIISTPLVICQQVIGTLDVQSKKEHFTFDQEDLQVLSWMATQASIAIENAKLYEESRQLDEIRLLHKISTGAATSLELDQVLAGITNTLAEVCHYEAVAILLLNKRTRQLTTHSGYAGPLPRPKQVKDGIALGKGITGWVAETGEPLLVADISQDSRYISNTPLTKAEMCAPLLVGSKIIGVIDVQSSQANTLHERDLQLLSFVAGHAANIIDRARQVEAIAHISQTLNASLDLNTTLDRILDSISPLIDFVAAQICLWDQGQRAIVVYGQSGDPYYTTMANGAYKLGEGFSGWIVRNQRPLLIKDIQTQTTLRPKVDDPRHPIRAFVGVPLKIDEERPGTLELISLTPNAFNEDDEKLLTIIGEHAITAIQNAHLYQRLETRILGLQALYEAGRTVTSSLQDLDQILHAITEQAARLTGASGKEAQSCSLLLVKGQQLETVAAYPIESAPYVCLPLDQPVSDDPRPIGIVSLAARTKISQLIGDVTKHPHYLRQIPPTHSELAVPLKNRQNVIGVINVEHADYNAFDEEDQRTLESLAELAVIAIHNHQQYQELKQAKTKVGAMTAVAWMGMVSAVWRHAIEGSVATIRDEIELIRDDLPPESLSLIENRLLRVQQLSQQVLERPITPPLADNEGVESINLSDFVQERIGQLRENEAFQQIEINLIPRLAEAYTVRASRAWLRQIFDIIVDNAAIALTNSPLPRLIIIVKQTGTQAEIIIHDTGPGIPADIQKKIFNQQIEKPQGSQGLGMGLLMAKTVAQAYGGDLNIKVSNKNGTSVVISFPIETPISASSGPAVERSMGTSDRPAARSIDLSDFTSA